MAAVTPAGEWNKLHDKFYHKRHCYDMLWDDINLGSYIVAGASYGGPIAIVRDPRKIQLYDGSELSNPTLRIFTSAGVLLSEIPWKYASSLVNMGWTNSESLIIVLQDGTIHIISIHGEELNQFTMGTECKEAGIAECCIWGTGILCRTKAAADTSEFQLYTVNDLNEPKPRRLARNGLKKPPASMTIIEPKHSSIGSVEALLATADGSIVIVTETDAQDQQISMGPFTKMVVSPTGALIACFNTEGTLYVFSTDFKQNLSKFGTSSKLTPLDVVWCGVDSVLLYWNKILLMVGPYGDYVKYSYPGSIYLITEIDGVRIISTKNCDFLQRVPESNEEIFTIDTTAPSAILYDACEAFEAGDARADENIRSIENQDDLEDAIEQCLDAAANEFDYHFQRRLLKSASYGALFCENWNADQFVHISRIIRVLNAIRHVEIGIPLTYRQYNDLGINVLVDRLINRYHHLLAIRICEYLRIPPERVLIHWACTKIQLSDINDDTILGDMIIKMLEPYTKISYAPIATTAFRVGRRHLATLLLDCEPKASEQVPMLIRMDEDELALQKAIESGDTDLVYLALLHLQRNGRTEKEFFNTIRPFTMARNLFVEYCKRKQDYDLLKSYYYHFEMRKEAADLAIIEAYECENFDARLQGLDIAKTFYGKDKSKPLAFLAEMTDDQIKLLQIEAAAENDSDNQSTYIDMSISDLIREFIKNGQIKRAQQVQSKFKVPSKRFWHIHIMTLVECEAWSELERLSQEKSPVGYEPFVEACVAKNNTKEASKYVMKLDDPLRQMEWLCNIDEWRQAAEVALKVRDRAALEQIQARCRDFSVQSYIAELLMKL